MNAFFDIFSKTQQFLILQGYADEILSEDELMTFVMVATTDERFLYVVKKGVFLVTPAVSLDDFQQLFIPKEQAEFRSSNTQLQVQLGAETLTADFPDSAEAESVLKDIDYLFSS